MGLGGIGVWQLVIIFGIVVLIFGTKRLRGIGGDLGSAIKGFKKGISEEEKPAVEEQASESVQEKVIDSETEKAEQEK